MLEFDSRSVADSLWSTPCPHTASALFNQSDCRDCLALALQSAFNAGAQVVHTRGYAAPLKSKT